MKKNITDILSEWFYRLPKGYATEPYSDTELKVLENILIEQGIDSTHILQRMRGKINEVDQLDQAFLDAKPVEDELNEVELWKTIKRVWTTLTSKIKNIFAQEAHDKEY